MRNVLIALHAVAGTAAFIFGLALLRTRRWYQSFLAALTVMTVTLVGAIVVDWGGLGHGGKTAFVVLLGLAGVMLIRAGMANRAAPRAFVDHVGFTLISLFVGFVVVLAIDLAAPAWLVVALGVTGVLLGRRAVAARGIRPARRRGLRAPAVRR